MPKLRISPNHKQSIVTSLAAAVSALLVLVLISTLIFILIKGSHYFWPQDIVTLRYQSDNSKSVESVYAQLQARTVRQDQALLHYYISSDSRVKNTRLTVRENDVLSEEVAEKTASIYLIDGNRVLAELLSLSSERLASMPIDQYQSLQTQVKILQDKVNRVRQGELADIHTRLALMDKRGVELQAPARQKLANRFVQLQTDIAKHQQQLEKYKLHIQFANGQQSYLFLTDIEQVVSPNQHGFFEKVFWAMERFWRFVSQSPKLDNTSGGVFPALFGTVLMVLLMTIFVTPFGVGAALYLHEYAPRNKLTYLIRISVNNLAGVPSIVYGVFGLGLFVYTIGGNIDSLFFSEELPAPTFGSPGLFWASLTMAILTLPVVIVATEEGLRRVPVSLKQGSYALGATQSETMFNTVLPMASPGIMTGIILAIARGAGDVAPLLLVGAVKFAPALPIDGEFPFVHFQRQFMHLGVLIYDGAFHSQSIGNGTSFMFACCMLLLVIVMTLNLIAIKIRSRLRKLYSNDDF